MKAIVYTEYGSPDVLHFQDVPQPTPGDQRSVDQGSRGLGEFRRPAHAQGGSVPDPHEFGAAATENTRSLARILPVRSKQWARASLHFKPGDEVFGDISACGWGGFAEYACATEEALVLKPANLSYEDAAAVPMAAVTALQGLRSKGKIQPGQKVLIYGASGGVGSFSVQIAKSFGAEVTAVCSTRHLDMVRSLGADRVIDYTQEDFSRNGHRYDLIIACNGDRPISDYRRALGPNGTYVMSGGARVSNGRGHAPRTVDLNDRHSEDGQPARQAEPRGPCVRETASGDRQDRTRD